MGIFERVFGHTSSIDRIVGRDKQEQKALGKQMDRQLRNQDHIGMVNLFEREKTDVEREAIRIANAATDALRERYGLKAYELPEKNFHIVRDVPEVRRVIGEEDIHGIFDLHKQAVASIERRSRAATFHSIFHEMVHFKSYTSIEFVPGTDDAYRERRSGLTARDSERENNFVPVNEGVTEELTKRFMREQEARTVLDAEMHNLQKARKEYPREKMEDVFSVTVNGQTPDGGTKLSFHGFGYKKDRQALHLLIDKLHQRNSAQPDQKPPRTKEEWFDMFASAMFNGYLLELARSIEKTFGTGKFRELGEQKNGEELLKFVESL